MAPGHELLSILFAGGVKGSIKVERISALLRANLLNRGADLGIVDECRADTFPRLTNLYCFKCNR